MKILMRLSAAMAILLMSLPASAGGFVAYLLDGITLLNRAPALAVMDYLPDEPS